MIRRFEIICFEMRCKQVNARLLTSYSKSWSMIIAVKNYLSLPQSKPLSIPSRYLKLGSSNCGRWNRRQSRATQRATHDCSKIFILLDNSNRHLLFAGVGVSLNSHTFSAIYYINATYMFFLHKKVVLNHLA